MHLECHSISFSNLNLIGLFSTEHGQSDVENLIIDWVLRLEKWHSKCNRPYIYTRHRPVNSCAYTHTHTHSHTHTHTYTCTRATVFSLILSLWLSLSRWQTHDPNLLTNKSRRDMNMWLPHVYTRTSIHHIYLWIRAHIHVYTYTCVYLYVTWTCDSHTYDSHTYTRIHEHVTPSHIHAYTPAHTLPHIYTHTCTQCKVSSPILSHSVILSLSHTFTYSYSRIQVHVACTRDS